ncbi:unnamed protein product [Polarella glacialis]|uniref:Guanine nucleotide-binding protein-like 1 n=1 Tax=Polarella glacialis TaxID=89957 RepID=A0A813DWA4_POLGL|nr:unnamed protein product [Polarella glacialis]
MGKKPWGAGRGSGKGATSGKGAGAVGGYAAGKAPAAPGAGPARLETVFGREDGENLLALKADAGRACARAAPAFEAGEHGHLLPYPCVREGVDRPVIAIPLRPAWTEEMGVESLNAQEASYFSSWVSDIYRTHAISELNYFEHNLEVWRQIWRSAFERADIVIIVLDARIPLFHFSQAVFDHVRKTLLKDVVIVLNKADIVPPASIQLWLEFFARHCPGVPLVPFCVPKSGSGRVEQLPCVVELFEALKSCSVLRGAGGARVSAAPFFEHPREEHPAAAPERTPEEFITVVLQGDPNMGKSSIINAVFGRKLVSSSATPGHTKHFQTLFLSRGVCFCDSPGVVCPKLAVPKALQVVFGSYRIAQVREPFHIVRFIAEHCHPPLASILKLAAFRDKDAPKNEPWSPESLCEAYARKKGYFRRGGRTDPRRAAMRLLNDALNGFGDLALCFAPPGVDAAAVAAAAAAAPPRPSWMARRDGSDDEGDHVDRASSGGEGPEESDAASSEAEQKAPVQKARNAFAALDSSDSESEASSGG